MATTLCVDVVEGTGAAWLASWPELQAAMRRAGWQNRAQLWAEPLSDAVHGAAYGELRRAVAPLAQEDRPPELRGRFAYQPGRMLWEFTPAPGA